MTAANVVDVSEWQPTSIDWANLKANGIKAVVVRIGHGVTRDEHAANHIANATKAGLIVHVYHYYEGVDGELQYSVNNAKSLNIQPNVYYFLDMEGTIAGSWPSIFDSFRKQWSAYSWNTGLYCSLSNYAKFDDATLVKQGVYRWIAAWGSNQPSNADMWQYDSKTGLGSYTSALDKDVDIAGKLIKEPDSTVVEPTDPNGNYTIKPGAFVGFDYSTTKLQGGKMLVASPDGQNKIPKLSPDGQFLFNNNDGDNMWTLIKPKIGTIKGDKADPGEQGPLGPAATVFQGIITDTSTDFDNLTSEGHYDIRFMPNWQGKNGPNDTKWGLLDVKVAGRMVVQTYYCDTNANVYVRNRFGGTAWTVWRQTT
ncbi:GH25 family lysozyme [Limosilactobacillus fermentum]|uniref:GH25 family lysozyme n=1 Tax=Limosilactobacillus fermentum TaxID=1613 RepID=UPI002570B0F6|nr:GH25 family lysozyme [Limosilactobacillus fermentum]WJD85319.1 GH25 family lysozyme [Limosilactobacillus fermentum]